MRAPLEDYLLEVCVDSELGLRAALEGGAQRLELCSRLDLDGLGPDPSLCACARRLAPQLPQMWMVRCRPGGFVLDQNDLERMCLAIDLARAHGAAGVVLGALGCDGRIAVEALQALVARARGLQLTVHRAFDAAGASDQALETLIACKVGRVLSSGGAGDAWSGRERLRALVERASGRIEVLAGGGVRAHNARALLEETGVRELHTSVPFRREQLG